MGLRRHDSSDSGGEMKSSMVAQHMAWQYRWLAVHVASGGVEVHMIMSMYVYAMWTLQTLKRDGCQHVKCQEDKPLRARCFECVEMDVCEAEWGHTTDAEFDYHGPLRAALAGSLVLHEVQTFIGFDIAFHLFASIVPLGEKFL
jgi:hypothetical protein